MIGGTSEYKAYSRGATQQRQEYQMLVTKYRLLGHTAPLGDEPPPSYLTSIYDTVGDREVKRILIAAAWREGQDKLRADIDARIAEVAQP